MRISQSATGKVNYGGREMKEQVLNLIFALQARLAAKQPMYEADEEWRDISAVIAALYVLVRKGWVK
jgi:hypothetical protein